MFIQNVVEICWIVQVTLDTINLKNTSECQEENGQKTSIFLMIYTKSQYKHI